MFGVAKKPGISWKNLEFKKFWKNFEIPGTLSIITN